MSATIQFFSTKQESNSIAFIGIITSDTPIFSQTDKIFQAVSQNVDGSFHLTFDSTHPIEPVENSYCGKPDPILDINNYDFNDLISREMWTGFSDHDPLLTGGFIFVRKSQTFKEENNHRYILCAVWKDTADFNQGEEIVFHEGEIENNNTILTHSKPLLDNKGEHLNAILKKPIWGSMDSPYRLNTDLHLNALETIAKHSLYLAEGNDPKKYHCDKSNDYINLNSLHYNDEDYRLYLISLLKQGFHPMDKLHLNPESYYKGMEEAGMNYFNLKAGS